MIGLGNRIDLMFRKPDGQALSQYNSIKSLNGHVKRNAMQGKNSRVQNHIKRARTLKDLKFTEEEYQKFKSGTHTQLYHKFGAHYCQDNDGVEGVHFSVWVDTAKAVSVIGNFNGWNATTHALKREYSEIWSAFIPLETSSVHCALRLASLMSGDDTSQALLYKYRVFRADDQTGNSRNDFIFTQRVSSDTALGMISECESTTGLQTSLLSVRVNSRKLGAVPISKRGRIQSTAALDSAATLDYEIDKCDPFAFGSLKSPTGDGYPPPSMVTSMDSYTWNDSRWVKSRRASSETLLTRPINIYEIHLGSYKRKEDGVMMSYYELAQDIIPYVKEMEYTHIELMPVMEHPFYGSWGYQVTGYFLASARYGPPDGLKYFIDQCHQAGIGVILDWVPAHFPQDKHGLAMFSFGPQYEYQELKRRFHPDWNTAIFDFSRSEVKSFLLSSARFWLDVYHADGLRVDAVASMLYHSYSRAEGEWVGNEQGGPQNWDAVHLLQDLNRMVHSDFPGCVTIAEESSSWEGCTHGSASTNVTVDNHCLGFDLKWDMGWMNDTLKYMEKDPLYRSFRDSHNLLTARYSYFRKDNFILPLSHDEVVHGKGSLLCKMPGDRWQRFANWKLLMAFQIASPGKKLVFMGQEFGQWREWGHDRPLDWYLAEVPDFRDLKLWSQALNKMYKFEGALHETDCVANPGNVSIRHPGNEFADQGIIWLEMNNIEESIIAFMRLSRSDHPPFVVILNFTPVQRVSYRISISRTIQHMTGRLLRNWSLYLNSNDNNYGPSIETASKPMITAVPEGDAFVIELTLPPLGAVFLKEQIC